MTLPKIGSRNSNLSIIPPPSPLSLASSSSHAEFKKSTSGKIYQWARHFFSVIGAAYFFLNYSCLFGLSFFAGLICNEATSKVAKRVESLYDSINFKTGCILVFCGILLLPEALVVQAILSGSETGNWFGDKVIGIPS